MDLAITYGYWELHPPFEKYIAMVNYTGVPAEVLTKLKETYLLRFLNLFILLPSLLLPSWGGLAGAIFGFLIICSLALVNPDKKIEKEFPKNEEIFRVLIGITVTFILLVALNYTAFP